MEDSDSSDSLSHENGADFQDEYFDSDITLRTGSSNATPGSKLPSNSPSSITTPRSYFSSQGVSPPGPSQIFPFTDNDFFANLHNSQDGNDLFSSTPGTLFNQPDNSLPLDNQRLDLGPQWNLTSLPSPSPARKGDDAMTGVEVERGKHGSTLILENVQPQMVTSIVKMLFESKSAVNMKIVRQE